ncbi:MAG TPA: protein kinase [Candidatus Acidoferrales bacterium]|nr:protein kinase [Candidatus Acidoferrales bacterium]
MPAPPIPAVNIGSVALAAIGQRYEILSEAGHGSMGNVYKARDRETGEIVALKLLKPEIASDHAMMERFKNELLFARKITHKNVCRMHEFNRVGGVAYTSMEFVEGESLRSVLSRFGGLPQRKAVDLALQICSGLKEAHAQGIVHRDLKPENIMVDAHGNVKIMDFGIARSMEAVTRLTGSMVGTPQYMAPEQVAGKPVDYRTDIYSLGLILYEMFTGTPAFQADNPVAVALKHMQEEAVPPHQIDPAIPAYIERTILKCLLKEPANRFQSIAQLEQALDGSAAQNSVAAAPVRTANAQRVVNAPAPVRMATPSAAPVAAQRRGPSPLVWIVLIAVIALGAFGILRGIANARAADLIPPARLPAPVPPEIAYLSSPPKPISIPAAEPLGPEPSRVPDESAATPVVSSKPAFANNDTPSNPQPEAEAPKGFSRKENGVRARPSAEAAAKILRNDDAASKAASKRQPKRNDAQPAAAIPAATGASYLFVRSFLREDRAKEAKTRIEALGMPADVIPKHVGNADVFIVYSGPYPDAEVASAMQKLEAKGFSNVRSVPVPLGGNKKQ